MQMLPCRYFGGAVHPEPLPQSFTRFVSQPGFSHWVVVRENVCFMDLAKVLIEVCVVRLVSSQPHSPFSPNPVEPLVALNTYKHQNPHSPSIQRPNQIAWSWVSFLSTTERRNVPSYISLSLSLSYIFFFCLFLRWPSDKWDFVCRHS